MMKMGALQLRGYLKILKVIKMTQMTSTEISRLIEPRQTADWSAQVGTVWEISENQHFYRFLAQL